MKKLVCLGCRKKLKLWIIERKEYDFIEYDTYESALVAAETEEDARRIHPNCNCPYIEDIDTTGTWTNYENVKATLIGIAAADIKRGVLLSDFHAG
jgi:hypothetical protein